MILPQESRVNLEDALQQPSFAHPLGTDGLGRDVLQRVVVGGRHTVGLSVVATLLTIIPASILGLYTAYHRGETVDRCFVALLDGLIAFPGLVLALVIVAVVGQGWGAIILAVSLSQFAAFGRFARAAALNVSNSEYVIAAVSIGANRWWVLRYHVLPNVSVILSAYSVLVFSYVVMNIAALAFLGLSGDLSTAEWGQMISENRQYLRVIPLSVIAPGVAITILVIGLSQLASYLRQSEF